MDEPVGAGQTADGGEIGDVGEAGDAAETGDASSGGLSTTLTTYYVGRWTGDDGDHDLTEVADVHAGDPLQDAFTFHVLAHGRADLDGDNDPLGDPFFSLADTFDSQVTARLYHAYVDAHRIDGLELARFGRQLIYDTPETLYFDGARLETPARGENLWRFGAYGGIPTYPYESSTDGDLLFGAFAEVEPVRELGLRGDYMHVEDEDFLGESSDDLFELSGTLRASKAWSLEASHSRLESDARDLRVTGRCFAAEDDLALELSYYELLETQKDLAVPLDPFYSTLFEYFPYRQVGVLASKSLGTDWSLQGGVELREVSDEDDVGPFNRDFARGFLTCSTPTLLPADVALALTGELWDGDDERYETWGVDLSRELDEDLRVDLGSYYSLYKYQFYLEEERQDVRTWYAGLRYDATARLVLRLRYELEDSDFDDFHVVRLAMTWTL